MVAVLTADDAGGLLDPVLRYVGDRAAVVAAEDPELARRAAELVRLDLEPLPAVLDPEEALEDPQRVAARVEIDIGDVEEALAGAERVVEGTWTFPFAPAVPLEPPVALTWLDEDRRLVVRTSAESPFRVRGLLADRLSIPAARIRVVRPLVAGGAGGGSDVLIEDLCAFFTLQTGRPARLALTAEEELTTTPGRPPQRVHVRLALRDGGVSGVALRLLVDVGGGMDGAGDLLRSAGRQALALYGAPSVHLEGVAVRTNRPPTAAPRGADDETAFALECALDEAAAALGEDPVAFRLRHLRRPGKSGLGVLTELEETPGADDARPLGEVLHGGGAEGGLERAGRFAHPGGSSPPGTRVRAGAPIGGNEGRQPEPRPPCASSRTDPSPSPPPPPPPGAPTKARSPRPRPPSSAFPHAAWCRPRSTPTRRPSRRGTTRPRSSLPVVRWSRRPSSPGSGSARPAPCFSTRTWTPSRLTDGAVRDTRGRTVSFAEIGTSALRAGQPLVATAAPSAASTPASDAAVFAEVEVDTETGVVRVLGLTAVLAGGPFEDPRPAEGQVEGALAVALERALAAGVPFDARRCSHHPLPARLAAGRGRRRAAGLGDLPGERRALHALRRGGGR